jgi:hypothetical protein
MQIKANSFLARSLRDPDIFKHCIQESGGLAGWLGQVKPKNVLFSTESFAGRSFNFSVRFIWAD